MNWTVNIKDNDTYGWFDYAVSDIEKVNNIWGVQHVKRAAPRFIETSIGPVFFEYEHVDREAIIPTKSAGNPLKRTATRAETILSMISLFAVVLGLTLAFLYLISWGK